MNKPHPTFSVEECKIQASILLKSLRSDDVQKAYCSAKRFLILPKFKNLSCEEVTKSNVKRKDALTVIAIEKGFKSWSELKYQLSFIRGGFLNQWFKNYEDAKNYLQSNGGFLLIYQNQFFVCDKDYIENLGFDPKDKDWQLIDFDWAKPKNEEAWHRLYKKWMKIQGGSCMSKSLPNNMFLQGIWEPIAFKCNIHDPIICGEIPKELNGTFIVMAPIHSSLL